MTTTDTGANLHLKTERRIAVPPDRIYNAWLDPKMLMQFMHPGPDMSVPHATSDGREGGAFEIVMKVGDAEIPHKGIYRQLSPHSRIVFTWESPFSPADSEVTLDFRPDGDGTHVTLTHVKFFDEEKRDNHAGGWQRILETLNDVMS